MDDPKTRATFGKKTQNEKIQSKTHNIENYKDAQH